MIIKPELYVITLESTMSWECKTKEKFIIKQKKYKDVGFVILEEYDPKEDASYQYFTKENTYTLSKDQIFILTLADIPFKIKQTIDVSINITEQLMVLAEKPVKLIQEGGGGNTYNSRCEVSMPGHTLALYNECLLLEDSCTDDLQVQLNSGWRIIAACPQPDQRRPDYILGRFNPSYEAENSAKRN